jgi:hypothetical protein
MAVGATMRVTITSLLIVLYNRVALLEMFIEMATRISTDAKGRRWGRCGSGWLPRENVGRSVTVL